MFNKIALSLCLALLFPLIGSTGTVYADELDSVTKRFARLALRNQKRAEARANNTNYNGGFHGKFVRFRSNCPKTASSFLFRHAISLSGNRVTLRTSHDGTLFGTTKNKGRDLEASTSFTTREGINGKVVVLYRNLKPTNAEVGYAIGLTNGVDRCVATFGGNAVRAF